VDDAALIEAAEIFGGHAEVLDIVRQEVAGGGLEDREPAAEDEDEGGEDEEGAAVADAGLEETAIGGCALIGGVGHVSSITLRRVGKEESVLMSNRFESCEMFEASEGASEPL